MIPVKDLYSACDTMLRDKWGYIWGTAGVLWSEAKQKSYTSKYANDSNRKMSCKYGGKWAGHMVADCSGVMVYIWKKHGLTIAHGSNSIHKRYCGAVQKDPAPGYAAFKVNGSDYHHIGIVAADGVTVYESKGTVAGFVTSRASTWDCFAPFKDVEYSGKAETEGSPMIYQAVVTTEHGSLNIRNEPSTDGEIIGKLPKGEIVDVLMDYGDWVWIGGDGKQGYVCKKYLTPYEEAPKQDPEPDPTEQNKQIYVRIPCKNLAQASAISALFGGEIE